MIFIDKTLSGPVFTKALCVFNVEKADETKNKPTEKCHLCSPLKE